MLHVHHESAWEKVRVLTIDIDKITFIELLLYQSV